jgi:hypothetical protein
MTSDVSFGEASEEEAVMFRAFTCI